MTSPDANALAYAALLFSFIPVLLAYGLLRPAVATAAVFIGGQLLLPEQTAFVIPATPLLDKRSLISLFALVAVLLLRPRLLLRSGFSWPEALLCLYLLGQLATGFANPKPAMQGPATLPGHTPPTVLKETLQQFLWYGVPLLLGRACYRSRKAAIDYLKTVTVAGLFHSVLFLWEVRMSPQLHMQLYGFYQHDFLQTVRGEGFRPTVFMPNGLVLAIFNMTAALCATSLAKQGVKIFRRSAWIFAFYLMGLIAVGRSFGAQLFTLIGATLIALVSPRLQAIAAVAVVVVVFIYPPVRIFDLLDTDGLVENIEAYSEERAQSLAYRFMNEDMLLERALEQPMLGWGGFCRWCIFDPYTGEQVSVSDGEWIIRLGSNGAVGLLTYFGMLTAPLFLVFYSLRRVTDPLDRRLLASMIVILALSTADLIPNSLANTNLLFLLSGATYSIAEVLPDPKKQVEDRPMAHLASIIGRIQAARERRLAG